MVLSNACQLWREVYNAERSTTTIEGAMEIADRVATSFAKSFMGIVDDTRSNSTET